MAVTIKVTVDQAQAIAKACETCGRLKHRQFDMIAGWIAHHYRNLPVYDIDKMFDALTVGRTNSTYKGFVVPKKPDQQEILLDAQAILYHFLLWDSIGRLSDDEREARMRNISHHVHLRPPMIMSGSRPLEVIREGELVCLKMNSKTLNLIRKAINTCVNVAKCDISALAFWPIDADGRMVSPADLGMLDLLLRQENEAQKMNGAEHNTSSISPAVLQDASSLASSLLPAMILEEPSF